MDIYDIAILDEFERSMVRSFHSSERGSGGSLINKELGDFVSEFFHTWWYYLFRLHCDFLGLCFLYFRKP